jgi:outer membrane receptor protein involved in Fe transport
MKYSKRQQLKSLALAVSVSGSAFMSGLLFPASAHSEALNTKLPATQDNHFNLPVTVDLPKQPLSMSLKEFARSSGLSLSFDNKLVDGKTAPAIKGRMTRKEVLRELLSNSGLTTELDGDNAVLKKIPDTDSTNIQLDQINVRAKRFYEIGPLPGLGLTKEQIPGNVQSITAKEIKDSHSLSITDLMNKKLQSVTVNDYQGNPFQMDVQYRGFTAGPQIGTPQGLSVFFDGIRVNEPFGDVVNWDMIPMNALAGVDVFPGSNPIFGLNTLGGAFTLKTKDGFNHEGFDAEVLTGSFGRKQLQVEGGINNGAFALFGAGNFFLEDGWRENSPSKVNQFFGKASYRGDKLDLNFSTLWVGTDLVGNGLLPSEMYKQDRNASFTSEDETKNRLQQFQLSGAFQATDNFTITGQVYRRNSDRHQIGADVFTDYDQSWLARRKLNSGEQYTCLFTSSASNKYGLPDYVVIPIDVPNGESLFDSGGFFDTYANTMTLDFNKATLNGDLSPEFATYFKNHYDIFKNTWETLVYDRNGTGSLVEGDVRSYSNGEPSYVSSVFDAGAFPTIFGPGSGDPLAATDGDFFYTPDGVKNYVMLLSPANADNCSATRGTNFTGGPDGGGPALTYTDPNGSNTPTTIDGALYNQTGVVEGTPTAVFNDNNIKQIVDGVSVQLNWSFEHHKFMVGASIDAADATYSNSTQLGFLDSNRNAFLAPDLAHPQFAGADIALSNNNFSGTNTTKSIYFSETWTPVDTWNFNFSGRYNETQTKNKVATRFGPANFGIGDIIAYPDAYAICPNANCTGVSTGYKTPDLTRVLNPAETEKFSYYSFNPSVGTTWQAKENLNVYANWAQGTRTPSVIELGCALDKTLVKTGGTVEDPQFSYKSVAENRECSLPTSLSGDPYLPQIKATSYDIGLRGTFKTLFGAENIQWNLGAYQTDLKDDIYFVAIANGRGFFDTIGNTRRRGLEAGISGQKDKFNFSLNFSLTDATFEDSFRMFSTDNSSGVDAGFGLREITVKPGNTMPGVPLHNLNASVGYDVTSKWRVGFSAVVHSESYVRGNENNKHQKGVARVVPIAIADPANPGNFLPSTITLPPTNNPGKLPGYATFNFQTSYQFNSEWTASMLINNVFDKEYFSAGRLGRNPFSPSINGAIGPDGYNHNSNDWLSTNFISPSAPRGVWFSLNWQFDPNAKPSF